VTSSLSRVSLDKGRIELNALLGVLETADNVHKLDIRGTSVGVDSNRLGVSPETFFILFQSSWERSLFEEIVTLESMLLSNLGVDIVCSLLGFLCILSLDQGHFYSVVVVFEESLVEAVNRLVKLLLLQKSICLPSDSFGKLHIIVSSLLGNLDSLVACLDAFVIVLHLKEDGGLVRIIGQFLGTSVNGLLVIVKCICELLLLVELITLKLKGLGFFHGIDLVSLLFWKRCLFSFLSLSLFLGLFCFHLSFALLLLFLALVLLFHLLFLHIHQVDAREFLKNVHESRVRLDELHEHLRVLLAHLPHVVELGVLEILRDPWVCAQFCFSLRTTKHVAHATTSSRSSWHSTHATHSSHLRLNIPIACLEAILNLCVIGVNLQALIVESHCLLKLTFTMESHCFSLVSFAPVGLDFDALFSIYEGLIKLLEVMERCRSVSINRVISWVCFNSLSVKLNCFVKILEFELLVSLLLCHISRMI